MLSPRCPSGQGVGARQGTPGGEGALCACPMASIASAGLYIMCARPYPSQSVCWEWGQDHSWVWACVDSQRALDRAPVSSSLFSSFSRHIVASVLGVRLRVRVSEQRAMRWRPQFLCVWRMRESVFCLLGCNSSAPTLPYLLTLSKPLLLLIDLAAAVRAAGPFLHPLRRRGLAPLPRATRAAEEGARQA